MTNREIRAWYLRKISEIADLDNQSEARGESLKFRALQAWAARRSLRSEARGLMRNPLLGALLQARDLKRYGNTNGPSFEFLFEKLEAGGVRGDEAYRAIIRSALTTDEGINRHFGV